MDEPVAGRETPSIATTGWPHLRAALVGLHVVAVLLAAAPSPIGGLDSSAWRDATVQGELDVWHARISRVIPGLDRAGFETGLRELAKDWAKTQRRVLKPFKPYYALAGTEQSWHMFVAPQRFPAALWIELMDSPDSDWRPLYVSGSAEYRWHGDMLEADRFRSATFRYAWRHYSRRYQDLGDWLADRAAEEFPSAVALRTRWYRYRTASPREVSEQREPEGEFEHTGTFQLRDRRKGARP